jgi:ubiquitin
MKRRLREIGARFGFWYEGSGGDKDEIADMLDGIRWSGSWDKLVRSDSSDFYYALFSNSSEGTAALIKRVADITKTIFDAIVDAKDGAAHEAIHGKTGARKFEAFLADCGGGLLSMAKNQAATAKNLQAFIRKGARMMWPADWRSNPTAASRVALRANKTRLAAIQRRPGVYFLGADHLQTLRAMDSTLRSLRAKEETA